MSDSVMTSSAEVRSERRLAKVSCSFEIELRMFKSEEMLSPGEQSAWKPIMMVERVFMRARTMRMRPIGVFIQRFWAFKVY